MRLLTCAGPGGVGKTRLALAVAASVTGAFADGVWFVSLAALRDPTLLAPAIGAALGLRQGAAPAHDQLRTYLRPRQTLLVLDNFEQLRDAAPLLADLLTAAAGLRVLITSRSPVRLYGEQEYPLSPLPLPDLTAVPQEESQLQNEAMRLFIARARAIQPGFAPDAATLAAIAAICLRLDGLPLAIELAAAQLRVFSPIALAGKLDHRLQLLTGGARDLPPRHQGLRATLDWSYDLLPLAAQRLFRRLAVFSGGWTGEALTEVCALVEDNAATAWAELVALAEASLLQRPASHAGEQERFTMLETIRDYAAELLSGSAEQAALRRQHAYYFLALAEQAAPQLRGREQVSWLRRLADEHDNLRAALSWALESGEPVVAARLGLALWRFWRMRGHLEEGRRWLERVLAQRGELALPLQAQVLRAAGTLANVQMDSGAAHRLLEASLDLSRSLATRRPRPERLTTWGWSTICRGSTRRRGCASSRASAYTACWAALSYPTR